MDVRAKNLGASFKLAIKLLSLKGNLVYEYNPFKNYRILNEDKHNELGSEPKGALLDLNTKNLQFSLNNPVDMTILLSYDGSVNVILNDGINQPRLINSRFSVTGLNTYQIVDREGDNDTNIYDAESFDTDISLYKKAISIAKIKFVGVSTGGNLPVGNYHFYFKLADADGNETDFIGESGLVTCYIGGLSDPTSILGGIRDLSSFKAVNFRLENLDPSYDTVMVYYTRSTADNLANKTTEAYKILKKYPAFSRSCEIKINGYEDKKEVSINDINVQYNVIESAKTLDIALNMLFLGNVNKFEIPYKELADLSLRFYPQVVLESSIGAVDQNYQDETGGYEYYNVHNIYHKLGYWNDEIYRFGVVYIMKDYTLSPVFNIRGRNIIDENSTPVEEVGTLENRTYIPIDKQNFSINATDNCKGVGRIKADSQISGLKVTPIGIKIVAGGGSLLINILKEYTLGCFFVRQKRMATTLCQGVTIGLEEISRLPVVPVSNNEYIIESFINKDRLLVHGFNERKIRLKEDTVIKSSAAICPEYELNAPFFNLFFTGSQFKLRASKNLLKNDYCTLDNSHFYNVNYGKAVNEDLYDFRIVSLQDSLALAKNRNKTYSALAGTAEEVQRVSYYKYRNPSEKAVNVLRGAYGPYLGLEGHQEFPYTMTVFDVKVPNYDEGNMQEYFQIRYLDSSPFEPISERMEWNELHHNNGEYIICYRGDCFIGNFTHRMVRNFADPTAPYNDEIISPNVWADEMNLSDSGTFENVNRGDVNAVKMGHWITVKVCSNINISLRSVDHSWATEEGLTNKPRAFYPLYSMNTSGENKVPESNVYNDGYTTSLSNKYNFEMPDVPAIKNVFVTRVMYSNIAITDSFKNGFRTFDLMSYKDYTLSYGELTRLLELKGSLIAVFEHGVCLIPVNERAVAGSGAGGNVFINTSNVLPDNPMVLSDMFGSQWPESVIKTPYYVYGVDTVGKKIWRTNGQNFEIISDFRVLKFLIDNITLTEFETKPIIGIRNVKTHYNAYKSDVMFTYYDNTNSIEEKVWNLCYNEITNTFTTLYSWVPSYSANIDNIMFSFDRDITKRLVANTKYPQFYVDSTDTEGGNPISNYVILGKININLDSPNEYRITLYDDNLNNKGRYKVDNNCLYVSSVAYSTLDLFEVAIKAEVIERRQNGEINEVYYGDVIYGTVVVIKSLTNYSTHFWKHGQAGLMELETKILPCFWYGKLHPFEFEFIVRDDPSTHKIFTNLEIISNKALPESFHFDIVGESYDFAWDKINIYCRLEATKLLYLALGSNIKFNRNYLDLEPKLMLILGSSYNLRSTYFPLYYRRIEQLDHIYDAYTMMQLPSGNWNTKLPRDYAHLSGTEVIYDPQLNEFRLFTHIKCCPLDGYYDVEIKQSDYEYILAHFPPEHRKVYAWIGSDGLTTKYYERIFYGRRKGNSHYKEDKWYVQIPSITFMLKNENTWNKPPIIVDPGYLPNDLLNTVINSELLPQGYTLDDVLVLPNTYAQGNADPSTTPGGWTSRKETKIRDKYMRVRIRYTGNDLAVISAIKTIYTKSYA